MIKRLVAASVMTMVLCLLVFSQDQPKGKIVVEGAIVAFDKGSRCSSCKSSRGLGTFVEFWIVRVDQWIDGVARGEKYIRVEYNIYERGLSDKEINSGKLRFSFRERREDERTDCISEIRSGSAPTFEGRKVDLPDYKRTKPGRLDQIPSLHSLPCLIAEDPPVVIE